MRHLLHYLQTRLQAQAAGVPYQGLCGVACFETNTVCMQFLLLLSLSYLLCNEASLVMALGLSVDASRFEIFHTTHKFSTWIQDRLPSRL